MSAPDLIKELRRCIETLRPYTGRPIGAPGSMARMEQEDRSLAYQRAIEIVDATESSMGGKAASHMTEHRTKGQIAYEKELETVPKYHDGTPRRPWSELGPAARLSWERNPTPRRQLPGPKEGERQ